MTTPSDCRRCGVCCFSDAETYVRLLGNDWELLGESATGLAHFIGNRAYMRMHQGHCAALQRVDGPDGERPFHCSVYDRRPTVCRELARGSPECAAELELKSTRVAAWVDQYESARRPPA